MPNQQGEELKPGANADYYYTSMNNVFAYIDDNFQENLSLNALAGVSGYSEYHFHRIFHAVTGKTLHDYVLCRKVYAAAARLLYEQCSITRIAFDCGFSSSSSFVRSFRKLMGCSPLDYRRNMTRKRPIESSDTLPRRYEPDNDTDALFSMTALPDLQVAGIFARGLSENFESRDIENAFARLFAWLKKSHLIRDNLQVMGITLDTPEVVSFAECRYFACVPADAQMQPEGGITFRHFPLNGQYITFALDRARADFADAFFRITDYLYGSYMPHIGCYPDNRPFVEFYSQTESAVRMQFCVPVRQQDMRSV
jgi:AraC family transcriptional regulator